LPTKKRPGEIGVWLKNGRRLQGNQMPQLKNIKDFGNRWLAWWKAIQPGWRGDELSQLVPSDPSWSQLLCGGANGFLVVILALAWWMQGNTSSGGSDLPHLKTAVVDVSWTLAQLKIALDAREDQGKKRGIDNADTEELPATKKYVVSIFFLD